MLPATARSRLVLPDPAGPCSSTAAGVNVLLRAGTAGVSAPTPRASAARSRLRRASSKMASDTLESTSRWPPSPATAPRSATAQRRGLPWRRHGGGWGGRRAQSAMRVSHEHVSVSPPAPVTPPARAAAAGPGTWRRHTQGTSAPSGRVSTSVAPSRSVRPTSWCLCGGPAARA